MNGQPKKSNWVLWVLGGCFLVIVIGAAAVVGVIYWGKQQITNIVEEQTDPVKREARLKQILGAEALPPGYHAGVGISLGVARGAWLSDRPMGEEPRYENRGFVYTEIFRPGSEQTEVEKFLSGSQGNVVEEMGVRLRSDERLGDGQLEVSGQKLHWYAFRGEVAHDQQAVPGVYSVITIRCSDDRARTGVWFQRVPAATATAEIPRAGSVIAEESIRDFFSHFRICN